jgi:hypothetical protein
MCKGRIKLHYITHYNLTLISTHTPTEEKDGVAKEEIHISLEKVCDAVPNYNRKTILADFNTKVGKKKS